MLFIFQAQKLVHPAATKQKTTHYFKQFINCTQSMCSISFIPVSYWCC